MPAGAMNLFRSRVDVFEAINRCEWQKVKDAVVPGKANLRDGQYDATLLHWVVNEGNVPTVEHLLSCGADVRLRDGKHSATPLHWAAAKGHVFVVRLLMMQESDVNSRDASTRTPLHWAAGNGQLGVIRELLFWGARVECTDAWKKVPLHWAAFRGHAASVAELVGKGSPVDQADIDGNVPGSTFHQSVPEETRKAIRAAMTRGPASGDSVVRAATDSSELLLETLHACRSWGELFENRHFDVLSKECQEHRERLRGVIQGLADAGNAEGLEPCLKAMDLLNSALGLHEDMRSGTKPVPLKGGGQGGGGANGGAGSGSGGGGGGGSRGRRGGGSSGGAGPPRAGGEHRGSEDLKDFLSTEGGRGGGGGAGAPPSADGGSGGGGTSSAASLRLYQLPAVREACGGFDPKRCIGEGGFGKVYRGSMMGLPVAVKKLDETGLQGREQFFREVEVLSTCRHENIVPLLGVCMEPPCLVYRLMPNNSLRHHLDDPALRARLGWRLRVRTTLHMCNGLEYLHSDSTNKPKVIHGDIKPENILLDEYLKARLSDFGISRVGESEASAPRSRSGRGRGGAGSAADDAAALQGTFGYMDPVYQSTGRLDERSDVFSLGVVMLELLTGDPVHCPEKTPPGLVDRVRKALDERALKGVVDRSAVWSKTAAKAYARLACGCCAENPSSRPGLREVSQKVEAIQETGQKNDGGSAARTAAAAAAGSLQQGQGGSTDDLLNLFDNVHNRSSSNNGRKNGGSGGGGGKGGSAGGGSGTRPSSSSGRPSAGRAVTPTSQQRRPNPPPPPPPPPYSTAIQTSSPKPSARPPPYLEALAAGGEDGGGGGGGGGGSPLVEIEGDEKQQQQRQSTAPVAGSAAALSSLLVEVEPELEASSEVGGGGGVEELVELEEDVVGEGMRGGLGLTEATGGGGGEGVAWWSEGTAATAAKPNGEGVAEVEAGQPSRMARGGDRCVDDAGAAAAAEGGDWRSLPVAPGLGGAGVDGATYSNRGSVSGLAVGASSNGAISCTRSTSLVEYGVELPGVLQAAKGGGVLSSNPRLLCVCCAHSEGAAAAAGAGSEAASSSTLPPADRPEGVTVHEAGHVSVLDLWHRGRTVRYPVAAERAAMSPNQSESVIAVLGGGSLHVFSIPRRCRLQEQAVATDLCMWRWLSPWGLALVTDSAVFYWSVSESPAVGNSPARNDGGSGGRGGSGDPSGEAHERDTAARLRRPTQAFSRRRTLITSPETLHRVYDYQGSADGRWGMLLCAVVDSDWGGGGSVGNGYGSHSSGIEGGGGPVKVDLYSFERSTTFEFEVLGATLMTMPGSSPPLNVLGLVVRGEGGATELRVLDLDRSLTQAEGPDALERLADHGEGWLIATTHVIADEDLRGSSACRVVNIDEGGGEDGKGVASLVSPPVFLRQWTENTNVLFVVGCHGLLLLLDVVTGAELTRAQACLPPVVEAEVDPDVGDLVVVSTADGGGVHRLTVRANALREAVEYDHKDPEMATRVSALTGYNGVRQLPPPRRQG